MLPRKIDTLSVRERSPSGSSIQRKTLANGQTTICVMYLLFCSDQSMWTACVGGC